MNYKKLSNYGSIAISLTIAFPAVMCLSSKNGFDLPIWLAIPYVALVEFIFLSITPIMSHAKFSKKVQITVNIVVALASLSFPIYEKYLHIWEKDSALLQVGKTIGKPEINQVKLDSLHRQLNSIGMAKTKNLEYEIEFYSKPENYNRVIWTDPKTGKDYEGSFFVNSRKKSLEKHLLSLIPEKTKKQAEIDKLRSDFEQKAIEYRKKLNTSNNSILEATAEKNHAVFNFLCFVGFYVFLISMSTVLKVCRYQIEQQEKAKYKRSKQRVRSNTEVKNDNKKNKKKISVKDAVTSLFYEDAKFSIITKGDAQYHVVTSGESGLIGFGGNASSAWRNALVNCRNGNVPVPEPWNEFN